MSRGPVGHFRPTRRLEPWRIVVVAWLSSRARTGSVRRSAASRSGHPLSDGRGPRWCDHVPVFAGSPETLGRFVFQTVHRNLYARKHDFFERPDRPMFVLWWVEAGHVPTLEDAKARIDHYRAHGSSDYAFGWADLAEAKAWMARRCAQVADSRSRVRRRFRNRLGNRGYISTMARFSQGP
jgi:hypothetical protein